MLVFSIIQITIWVFISLLTRGIELPSFIVSIHPILAKASNGFYYELANKTMPFELFFVIFTLSFLIYFLTILKIPDIKASKTNLFIIFVSAIMLRIVLVPSIPIHENDIYRYLWDGKVALEGINPFKYAPERAMIAPDNLSDEKDLADFETLKKLRIEDREAYKRIGYKDVPTIYPPLTQVFFIISNMISRGSISFMKFLIVLFDIWAIFLIYKILQTLKINPLYCIVYAWCPLVLKEYANSGHYDTLCISLVLLAIYSLLKKKSKTSGAIMGLAVLAKFYPLIFIPFYLRRKNIKAFLIAILVILTGYLPFFIWGKVNLLQVFAGLGAYTKSWAINGAVFEFVYALLAMFRDDPYYLSKYLCAIAFVLFWLFIFIKKKASNVDFIKHCFFVLLALFLLSPVGDPWYFCWIIPFLCIYRCKSIIVLSYLLIISYFDFTRDFGKFNLGLFTIDYLILVQYVPFYLIFILSKKNQSHCMKAIN